ncbi:hypothetical protein CHA01nite_32110 [Chryseobacterium hagamense]|uniref:Uncharacterized protein n=1 Tax=Chryseobacterium hagamense TaxID=395935 RepID=A0A511YQK7_9FLAO|nr:hypothetical protein CHA01nite_32110 [Chryseobacterium hagamense]
MGFNDIVVLKNYSKVDNYNLPVFDKQDYIVNTIFTLNICDLIIVIIHNTFNL